jgi:hypothetical protein
MEGTPKRLQLHDLVLRVAPKSEEGSRQSGVTSRLTAYWAPVIMNSAGYSELVSAPCSRKCDGQMKKILIMIATIGILLVTGCGGSDSHIETLPNEEPGTNPYTTIVEGFDLLMPSGNRVYGMI